jgi:hypothetical protein
VILGYEESAEAPWSVLQVTTDFKIPEGTDRSPEGSLPCDGQITVPAASLL